MDTFIFWPHSSRLKWLLTQDEKLIYLQNTKARFRSWNSVICLEDAHEFELLNFSQGFKIVYVWEIVDILQTNIWIYLTWTCDWKIIDWVVCRLNFILWWILFLVEFKKFPWNWLLKLLFGLPEWTKCHDILG